MLAESYLPNAVHFLPTNRLDFVQANTRAVVHEFNRAIPLRSWLINDFHIGAGVTRRFFARLVGHLQEFGVQLVEAHRLAIIRIHRRVRGYRNGMLGNRFAFIKNTATEQTQRNEQRAQAQAGDEAHVSGPIQQGEGVQHPPRF